jgi:hypothetical protein
MSRLGLKAVWIVAVALAGLLRAQDVPLNLFSSLAPKATEKVEVTLDGPLLQMAAMFMDDKDPEESQVKQIIVGLKGIYVRSFKFARPGEYSDGDLQAIRAQLGGWSQIVNVQKHDESTGVYLKTDGKKIQGMVVLTAEPMELTVVNIAGAIDLDQMRKLSGHLGIPELGGTGKNKQEKGK